MTLVDELESVAHAAVRAAVDAVASALLLGDLAIQTKTTGLDIVTAADLASEQAVVDVIDGLRPLDGFLGEEGHRRPSKSGITWVVDPVDSTANLARGIPIWSVSIAARSDDRVLVSAVACPPVGEVFLLAEGGDLRLNGVVVADDEDPGSLSQSLGLIGWEKAASPQRMASVVAELVRRSGKVRSPGSPALGLAWAAAGRADFAYYEQSLQEWDIAAGLFMCRERGLVTRFDVRGQGPHRLLVASRQLYDELEEIVFGED